MWCSINNCMLNTYRGGREGGGGGREGAMTRECPVKQLTQFVVHVPQQRDTDIEVIFWRNVMELLINLHICMV